MDDLLQIQLIKGIKALARTDHHALLTEWLVSICQCIEKNLQLIKLYEKICFFPESAKALEPYTRLTLDDLHAFCGFNDLVPTTLEEIIALDQNLRGLLSISLNKNENGTYFSPVNVGSSVTNDKGKIKRLRIIITEQERIIQSLKKRLQKMDVIDPLLK